MKFLQELVSFKRLDTEDDVESDELSLDDEGEFDEYADDPDYQTDEFEDEPPVNADEDLIGDESIDDEFAQDDEFANEEEPPVEDEFGDEDMGEEPPMEEPAEPEDPNRQGMIRTVKGAHLVYKREVEDGTYEELWQYNTSTLRDEITVRKAILAGTDIPVNKSQSPDGSQSFETWAVGNAELLLVKGLQQ